MIWGWVPDINIRSLWLAGCSHVHTTEYCVLSTFISSVLIRLMWLGVPVTGSIFWWRHIGITVSRFLLDWSVICFNNAGQKSWEALLSSLHLVHYSTVRSFWLFWASEYASVMTVNFLYLHIIINSVQNWVNAFGSVPCSFIKLSEFGHEIRPFQSYNIGSNSLVHCRLQNLRLISIRFVIWAIFCRYSLYLSECLSVSVWSQASHLYFK